MLLLLQFRLVAMSLVFIDFIFAQSNFCSYEEDYYEYVPKTINVVRKKSKKQKSAWRYLNPMNLFSKDSDYETVNKTEMVLEKTKRTVKTCCRGFMKIGEQCVSAFPSNEKSGVSLSSTVISVRPESSTSIENVSKSTFGEHSSDVADTISSSEFTTKLILDALTNLPEKVEEPTSVDVAEVIVSETMATSVTVDESRLTISPETESVTSVTVRPEMESEPVSFVDVRPETESVSSINLRPTIFNSITTENYSRLPQSDDESELSAESITERPSTKGLSVSVVESVSNSPTVQLNFISEQTTSSLKIEEPEYNSSSGTTLVSPIEDIIVNMITLPNNPNVPVIVNSVTEPKLANISTTVAANKDETSFSAASTKLEDAETVSMLSSIRELVSTVKMPDEKIILPDTLTTSFKSTEVPENAEDKTKGKSLETVDFEENNHVATDITPVVTERPKKKYSIVEQFIRVFLQFFQMLFHQNK